MIVITTSLYKLIVLFLPFHCRKGYIFRSADQEQYYYYLVMIYIH